MWLTRLGEGEVTYTSREGVRSNETDKEGVKSTRMTLELQKVR